MVFALMFLMLAPPLAFFLWALKNHLACEKELQKREELVQRSVAHTQPTDLENWFAVNYVFTVHCPHDRARLLTGEMVYESWWRVDEWCAGRGLPFSCLSNVENRVFPSPSQKPWVSPNRCVRRTIWVHKKEEAKFMVAYPLLSPGSHNIGNNRNLMCCKEATGFIGVVWDPDPGISLPSAAVA